MTSAREAQRAEREAQEKARLEAYIAKVAAAAPLLTEEQLDIIAAVLRSAQRDRS